MQSREAEVKARKVVAWKALNSISTLWKSHISSHWRGTFSRPLSKQCCCIAVRHGPEHKHWKGSLMDATCSCSEQYSTSSGGSTYLTMTCRASSPKLETKLQQEGWVSRTLHQTPRTTSWESPALESDTQTEKKAKTARHFPGHLEEGCSIREQRETEDVIEWG